MRIAQLLSLTLLVGLTLCLVGCGGDETSQTPEEPKTVAVVNVKCPLMGDKLNQAAVPETMVREFNGQKIGFCCPPCMPKWDALSEEDKATKLAAAMLP
ncbi:MAG: hypothetical protein QGH94_11695 [Phycisphaerae bacterium]|jgi:hypothetical protein|nr:hypothetical protein [Phycisphaerae bacterium]MDP7288644.1 hypothetical protein [Phycisphaerae bacterium]